MKIRKSIYITLLGILFFYILAIFANFITPYNSLGELNSNALSYSPPIKIRFNLKDYFYFYSYKISLNKNTYERTFSEIKNNKCKIKFFSQNSLINSSNCPYSLNLLGTDKLGRDSFTRLLFGLRPSLFSAILGILIVFPIGIIYGVVSGYHKGILDQFMMRIVEIILSLPSLYLLIVLAGVLPPGIPNTQKLMLITGIIGLISWAGLARIIRGQTLSVCEREFIKYAYLLGVPKYKILIREIIPQLYSYIIIAITISFPSFILGETTLSFLGLGISEPDASLGTLLAEGKELNNLFLRPWLGIMPSLILIFLAWNSNILGDSLRNLFDPKNSTK